MFYRLCHTLSLLLVDSPFSLDTHKCVTHLERCDKLRTLDTSGGDSHPLGKVGENSINKSLFKF